MVSSRPKIALQNTPVEGGGRRGLSATFVFTITTGHRTTYTKVRGKKAALKYMNQNGGATSYVLGDRFLKNDF
jgi:hypothetical protein